MALLFLLSVTVAAADPLQIALTTKATVDEEHILLGDIAQIKGGENGQIEKLGQIDLGRAPSPGESQTIHRRQVEARLKQNGLDPSQYHLEDAGPIKVFRTYAGVSDAQIRAAVEAFIKNHAPWQPDQMKIRPIGYNESHKLPPGELRLQVMAPKHTDWVGAIPFQVRLLVDGQQAKRVSVSAYIEVWQEVVVAVKPLGRNQPINRDDLQLQRMNMARVPANALVSLDQALGYRANRAIAVNSVLRTDQVDLPPVIRKGDVVQMLAESSQLKITTQAVAQENGGLGQTIQVINLASRKNVHARIIDAQTVKVEF